MKTLNFQAEIGTDGKLRVEVPVDFPPGLVDAVLVVQPVAAPAPPYDTLRGILAGKVPDLDFDQIQAATREMDEEWKRGLDGEL